MAGKITALVVQKKNKERVNVFIDEKFTLGVTLNTALTLKKGQYLDDKEIAELKAHAEIDKAYYNALNFLSFRARSRHEIEHYLNKKEVSDEAIAAVVDRLLEQGYLNDADFGRLWVENRNRLNPKGAQALRYELRQKGLHDKDIDLALSELDENALAWEAVEKKLTQWQLLDDIAFRKKLTGYLGRRGFGYQTINDVFQRARQKN